MKLVEDFLTRVDARRRELKLTKTAMLKAAELADSSLRNWERGSRPNIESVVKIANVLDVPPEHFFKSDGNENDAELGPADLGDDIDKYFENDTGDDIFEVYQAGPGKVRILIRETIPINKFNAINKILRIRGGK